MQANTYLDIGPIPCKIKKWNQEIKKCELHKITSETIVLHRIGDYFYLVSMSKDEIWNLAFQNREDEKQPMQYAKILHLFPISYNKKWS